MTTLSYGAWLDLDSVLAAEALAVAGFDWVAIDLQHGEAPRASVVGLLAAVQGRGAAAWVRVQADDLTMAAWCLDMGADVVVVPQVSSAAEAHAAAWLGALGLAGMENRRIGELSGGQAQRVAIARAQVTGAPVVFADEPTGALDSTTSSEVLDALLHATTGQGRSLVVVTHDAEVARRCDRVLRMRDGRIVDSSVAEQSVAAARSAGTAEVTR